MQRPHTAFTDLTDLQLIAEFRQTPDQTGYFNELVYRYAHLIYFLCRKYARNSGDAEDYTIEILARLPVLLQKYDVANFKSWLCRIAKNFCIDRIQKNGPRILSIHDVAVEKELIYLPEPDLLSDSEILAKLDEAVQKLDDCQRQCLQLFFYENKSYQDIMTIMNIGYDDVRRYLQGAKRRLRCDMSQRGIYAEIR